MIRFIGPDGMVGTTLVLAAVCVVCCGVNKLSSV
jgi:hypothetical protein